MGQLQEYCQLSVQSSLSRFHSTAPTAVASTARHWRTAIKYTVTFARHSRTARPTSGAETKQHLIQHVKSKADNIAQATAGWQERGPRPGFSGSISRPHSTVGVEHTPAESLVRRTCSSPSRIRLSWLGTTTYHHCRVCLPCRTHRMSTVVVLASR